MLEIYKLTKTFPKEELYSLVDQIRRAAISIVSNIAEGFSRESYREKVQFYAMARGSVTEVQSQLLIAKDLGYVSKTDFDRVAQLTVVVHKLLSALVKSSKVRIQNKENTLGITTGLININSASQSDLESLPGVGPVTAGKIIDGRPYQSIEELKSKKAVGNSLYDKIKDKWQRI